jgi:uncharacterized protein
MWIWLLAGCNENFLFSVRNTEKNDEDIVGEEEPSEESLTDVDSGNLEPSNEVSVEPSNEASNEASNEPANEVSNEPSDDEDDPVEEPGDSVDYPRRAQGGDVIVNEVMIDSDSVPDSIGEWVELYNTTGDWLDLGEYHLADQGADNYEIMEVAQDSMIVEPHGFAVICAEANYWNNGGIDCQGTFFYQTFGSGFALSNTEDEVILYSNTNQMIDRMTYVAGFSVIGESMGVSPPYATEAGNDYTTNWCAQWGFLPQGDAGSPGEENDTCW